MQQKRRQTVFALTLLCASLSLLLAACGSQKPSLTVSYKVKHHVSQTTPASTSTTGTSSGRVFVGKLPDMNAWIAIARNSNAMTAFVTDGSPDHPATFAQWFRGPVSNNSVQATPGPQTTPSTQATTTTPAAATPATTPGGTATATVQPQLSATLTQNAAMGTITLSNGKSSSFTANAVNSSDNVSGLYSSETSINNTKYLAGWIIPPGTTLPPAATVTPGTSTTPSTTETTTTTPVATATSAAASSPTATTTPGVSSSGASAIIDEQTGQVVQGAIPLPSSQDLNAKQISVPNLGTFPLNQCGKNQC